MKNPFALGESKEFRKRVTAKDLASFESGEVHPFYATFALARDAEWACRLFVLEMKDEDEEGIGTFIQISHMAPAFLGDEVVFMATLEKAEGNNVNCRIRAVVNDRVIADGRCGQKILNRKKLEQIMERFNVKKEKGR